MPTTEEEVWRYSRIDELELDAFEPVTVAPDGPAVPAGAAQVLAAIPQRSGAVVVRNGFVLHVELDDEVAGQGVHLGPVDASERGEHLLGAAVGTPVDVFGELSDALAPQPLALVVPRGVTVPGPVVVIDWVDADAGAVFPRLVVRVDEGAEVRVVEWQGGDDVLALSVPVVELDAATTARLRHVTVQQRGPRVTQIAEQVARAERDATVESFQVALGGDYARTRTDFHLVGRGATGNIRAMSFGQGDQMLDFRTFQNHAAPDTTSNLLTKGAVGGSSRSVYTGLIRVAKDARGTNAFQTNNNIKLSSTAWAESVPNLEIENNDVHCSHASTVGPVDEDQLFYLESRGVPTTVAERLIVAGFFADVLGQVPVAEVGALATLAVESRLDERAAGSDRSPQPDQEAVDRA